MTSVPATPAAVANEFLSLAQIDRVDDLTPMKLQKLVYYAHAWHLGMGKGPLFEEDIEAWPYGPVIRSLYVEFKNCGRDPINQRAKEISVDSTAEGVGLRVTEPTLSDERTRAHIKGVWHVLGKYSGIQLSNATHAPGEPWTIVKDKLGSLESRPSIPNSLIEEVFRRKLNSNAA